MLYEVASPGAPSRFIVRDSLRPDRRKELRISAESVLAAVTWEAPFLVRDRSGFDSSFIEDLREFICLRLDRIDPYKESKEYCLQTNKKDPVWL